MQKHPLHPALRPALAAGRFLGTVFGLVFCGIGITVIGFMWFGGDDFGSPPTFVKIFASFIALGFIAMGGTLAVSAILGAGMVARHGAAIEESLRQAGARSAAPGSPAAPAGYACPHCGGALGASAEVSPMGDTRCTFCGQWFNVHGRKA